jgi:hypothetical protein
MFNIEVQKNDKPGREIDAKDDEGYEKVLSKKTKKMGKKSKNIEKNELSLFNLSDQKKLVPMKEKLTIDSGASRCVMPSDWYPEYKAMESEEQKAGVKYVAANGKVLEDEGCKILNVVLEDGKERTMKFNLAKVTKPLAAVSQICKAGHRVVMDLEGSEGSFIENKATGERTAIYLENGVFVMDVWVSPPSGFARQE